MTVNQTSTVVGVFSDKSLADEAIDALQNAGFSSDQIYYSASGSTGKFFEDLKNLFTGPAASGEILARDLSNMGLSDEEARYYAQEYSNGHAIVAVKAPGREQEALIILHRFGAHNYRSHRTATEQTLDTESTDQVQMETDEVQQSIHPTNEASVAQQPVTQPDVTPLEPATQADQPDDEPDADELQRQHIRADVEDRRPEEPSDEEDSRPVTPVDYQAQPSTEPSDEVRSHPMTSTDDEDQQFEEPSVEEHKHPMASTEYKDQPSVKPEESPQPMATTDYETEYQQVQRELEETQRQLQDAHAQLQAMKDREAQYKMHQEREMKLKEARKQLDDTKAELEATRKELSEIQSRMSAPVQ